MPISRGGITQESTPKSALEPYVWTKKDLEQGFTQVVEELDTLHGQMAQVNEKLDKLLNGSKPVG